MDNEIEEILIGVMDLNEARAHQLKLRAQGVELIFKTNDETCRTGGCKVTVEVWGRGADTEFLQKYFRDDYLKNIKGHEPNFNHLSSVYDPSAEEVICQACGMKFSPKLPECPDCGLVYS